MEHTIAGGQIIIVISKCKGKSLVESSSLSALTNMD